MTSTAPRPTLTERPDSTMSVDLPGGYPRSSTVFAGNPWARPSSSNANTGHKGSSRRNAGMFGTIGKYKGYFPAAVAGYFPDPASEPSTPTGAETPRAEYPPSGAVTPRAEVPALTSRAEASPSSVKEPEPTVESGSKFTELLSPAPTPPPKDDVPEPLVVHTHEDGAVQPAKKDTRDIEPLPAVAPFATVFAGHHRTEPEVAVPSATSDDTEHHPPAPMSILTGTRDQKPPTASPTSLSLSSSPSASDYSQESLSSTSGTDSDKEAKHHVSFGGLSRFVSTRRTKTMRRHRQNASLGGNELPRTPAPVSGADRELGRRRSSDDMVPGKSSPRRHKTILRTLRGEATLLAGKLRHDPKKVEEGRRMVAGEV